VSVGVLPLRVACMCAKGYDMKNPLREYKYAMQLLFDEDAENLVLA
jgi:hypothetical protein